MTLPNSTPVKPIGKIEFSKVSFRYPSLENTKEQSAKALDKIDPTIKAGEIVALVGLQWSRKNNLAALLSRLYDPWRRHCLFRRSRPPQNLTQGAGEAVQASVPQNLSFLMKPLRKT